MDTTTDAAETAREVRLRRAAQRQGLTLRKSRARDPRATGYGLFHLIDAEGRVVAGGALSGYALSLDDVEVYLADAGDFAVYLRSSQTVVPDDDGQRPFLEWQDNYPTGTTRDGGTWVAQGWLLTERSDTPRERFLSWPRHALAQAARAARLTLAAWADDDADR